MNLFDYLAKHDLLDRVELGVNNLNGVSQATADCIIYEIFEQWRVIFNHRAKCRSGQVAYTPKKLSLTSKFFEAAGREADHIQTLLHEVAHIIVHVVWPFAKRHHGREWKYVMRVFGLQPNRCSNYEYMGRSARTIQTAKHQYRCMDCGYEYLTMRKLKDLQWRSHKGCEHKTHGGKLRHTQLR